MKSDTPRNPIAALVDAAKAICDGADESIRAQGDKADEMEICIHCGELRITIERSPKIEAENAVAQAQVTSKFAK